MGDKQQKLQARCPIAVLISDVHYNLQTVSVADACLRQAFECAKDLDVSLVIAGDLLDTKANIRAEYMNVIIGTFSDYLEHIDPIVLRGNHDSINEKSQEHSLAFIRTESNASIVATPVEVRLRNWSHKIVNYVTAIPYTHDVEALRAYLKTLPDDANIIMHQGLQGALPGEYNYDKTALSKADVARFNVISGHYHNHQVIDTGEGRTFTYIGNPYTLNFGEANDHPKGFLILFDDFSVRHVPTNVRKHIVIEMDGNLTPTWQPATYLPDDIVKVKVTGNQTQLAKVNKQLVSEVFGLTNFRLDLIPTDSKVLPADIDRNQSATKLFEELLALDEQLAEADKERLKRLWGDFSA